MISKEGMRGGRESTGEGKRKRRETKEMREENKRRGSKKGKE